MNDEIFKDLMNSNIEGFEKGLRNLSENAMSYADVGTRKVEKKYYALISGMLIFLFGQYKWIKNDNLGRANYDIVLEPKDKMNNGLMFEIKSVRDMDYKTIKETVEIARMQIVNNKYEEILHERGVKNIVKILILCDRKNIKVELL